MDILVGIIMVVVGLALVFAGLRVFALLLPILGFMAGISLGLAIMHWAFDENLLSTAAGIVVGIIIGIAFAILSYLFWYAAVVLGAAMIGASAGAALMEIFNVNTDWVILLVAIIGGALLAAATILLNLPIYWVIVVTAMNGAAWTVAGVMLAFDVIDRIDLDYGTVWAAVEESWFWLLAWAVVAAIGIGAQLARLAEAMLPEDPWSRTPPPQMA
jgi:hypothetical protein